MLESVATREREAQHRSAGATPSVHSPRVLLALDGSQAAGSALPTARAVAAQLDSLVEAIHVGATSLPEPELRRTLQLEGERALELRFRVGDPVQEILQAAGEPNVELVVLTTHGHEIDGPRGLTSVVSAVIASTMRPVLLVRPEAAGPRNGLVGPLQRFLVPLDGDPRTTGALGPAMELVDRLGATVSPRIDLLIVAHPKQALPTERGSISAPFYVDQPQHEWPAWRGRVRGWLRACCHDVPAGMPVRVFLTPALARSEVGAAIATFASEHEDDAIVLVRRSHLEPGRAPILRQVLHVTPCPVLLVPGPPRIAAPNGRPQRAAARGEQ